jgi:hypothetical protein
MIVLRAICQWRQRAAYLVMSPGACPSFYSPEKPTPLLDQRRGVFLQPKKGYFDDAITFLCNYARIGGKDSCKLS